MSDAIKQLEKLNSDVEKLANALEIAVEALVHIEMCGDEFGSHAREALFDIKDIAEGKADE